MLSKKGLKMSISKSFKNNHIEKSESVITSIRGKHNIKNGYRFIDDLENNRIILFWQNEERVILSNKNNKVYRLVFRLDYKTNMEKIERLYHLLDRHGFSDYIEMNSKKTEIYLTNFY